MSDGALIAIGTVGGIVLFVGGCIGYIWWRVKHSSP